MGNYKYSNHIRTTLRYSTMYKKFINNKMSLIDSIIFTKVLKKVAIISFNAINSNLFMQFLPLVVYLYIIN